MCWYYGKNSIFISGLVYTSRVKLSILKETYKKGLKYFIAIFVLFGLTIEILDAAIFPYCMFCENKITVLIAIQWEVVCEIIRNTII